MARANRRRVGNWLPADHRIIHKHIERLRSRPLLEPTLYIEPILDLQDLVASSPMLAVATQAMFLEGYVFDQENPLGAPSVTSWPEFLALLNAIMTTAPEFYVDSEGKALGLVGFPINALLDWPMGTATGYDVFSNELFNAQFKKVLDHWSVFLASPESLYVLNEGDPNSDPPTVAWLSDTAKQQMIQVACEPSGGSADCLAMRFEDIFQVPDPDDPVYLGFTSWDHFFTRDFQPGLRPVGDAPVVSACESAPLQYVTGVHLSDRFWLKTQPYSLANMLDFAKWASVFDGGSVYQAFLSAESYHRWNAPIDGKILDAFVVNGSYYLENRAEGVDSAHPDPSAPNASQPFITSVASRAVILIEAGEPGLGCVAFVAVGMAEVSSCEIDVAVGDTVSKGAPLGTFHFGGSTHCLVFEPGVTLAFHIPVTDQPNLGANNVAVKSNLASLA